MKQSANKSTPFIVDDATPSPGKALAAIRVEKGIPDDYVRSQLGLTGTLFTALENDDYKRLPAAVFVRGYLRRYAELIGARPAAVLASYQHFLEQNGLVEAPVAEEAESRPLFAMASAAVAMLLATSLVFGAMLTDGGSDPELSDAPMAADPAESPISIEAEKAPVAAPANRLQLEFVTDSWVEIVDAKDHILAVSLQRAGTRLDLEGTPPFEISLGYGPGVNLTYLNEPVALEPDPQTHAVEMLLGK